MSSYQLNAINDVARWFIPMAFVVIVYFGGLKQPWPKKVLIAIPSILFAVLPMLLVIATPNAPNINRFAQVGIWNISIHLAYLLALALIVFNVFYVKTWFHLLQILNIAFAAMAYFNAALAITGDG